MSTTEKKRRPPPEASSLPDAPRLRGVETIAPSIIPSIEPKSPFSPMLQGTATNTLTKTSTRRTPPTIDAVTGLATITNGGMTIFIEGYNKLTGGGLQVSTHKLLDLCTLTLTAQNDYKGMGVPRTMVRIALDDYMDALGIPVTKPSKDKARRQVRQDLETLYGTSIEWSEPYGGQVKDFAKTRICSLVAIEKGHIVIDFTPAFTRYLTHSYLMQYPREILQISEKNSNSYYLGKKLLLHYSIDNNRARGTYNILSVRVLLEHAPELPSYDQVRSTDRAYSRRIIDPFERDMNALEHFLSWEYCNAKGLPLTEAQREKFTYEVFAESFIRYEVWQFPDPSDRLARKAAGGRKKPSVKKRQTDGSDT